MIRVKNNYLDSFLKFSPKELVYKFEKYDVPEDHDNVIITEKFIGDRTVAISRHKWNMHAMYHSLKMYKLAYVYSGTFTIYVEGRPSKLPCGSMCIVPPNVIQKFTIDHNENNDDAVLINILIRASSVKDVLSPVLSKKNDVSDYLSKTLLNEGFPKFMILRSPSEFTANMAEVFFSETLSSKDSEASFCMLNALVFSYLEKDCRIEYCVTNTDRTYAIYKILNCIQNEYKSITLEDLSERFHYTPSYICRIIKKHTGMTFKEYLSYEKLGCACRELSVTDKPINIIASESGWQTLEHFYRVFKKKYGLTPMQYRAKVKKELFGEE